MATMVEGHGPVEVTQEIMEGMDAARVGAGCNMLDRPTVAQWLFKNGYMEAAEWAMTERSQYATAIFRGLIVEPDVIDFDESDNE